MEIIIAEHSGFCFGVNRAIDMAFSEAERTDREGRLYTCGHLIHNAAVVSKLKEKGVDMISSLSEAGTGDTVIVRVQSTVESGEIAVVLVGGDEATCKKVQKTPEGVLLLSINPSYEPMFFSNEMIESLPVLIFGKVVEMRRTL